MCRNFFFDHGIKLSVVEIQYPGDRPNFQPFYPTFQQMKVPLNLMFACLIDLSILLSQIISPWPNDRRSAKFLSEKITMGIESESGFVSLKYKCSVVTTEAEIVANGYAHIHRFFLMRCIV